MVSIRKHKFLVDNHEIIINEHLTADHVTIDNEEIGKLGFATSGKKTFTFYHKNNTITVERIINANNLSNSCEYRVYFNELWLQLKDFRYKYEQKTKEVVTNREIIKEVVKIKCGYCRTINFETSLHCSNCGASL